MHRRIEAPSTAKMKGDRQEDEDGLTSLEIPSTLEMDAKQPFKREQQARAEEEDGRQLWMGTLQDTVPLNVVGCEKKWVFEVLLVVQGCVQMRKRVFYNDDSLCSFDSCKIRIWCDQEEVTWTCV